MRKRSSVYTCARAMRLAAAAFAVILVIPTSAASQVITAGRTVKVAFYNIQSGKGEPGLAGRAVPFADTTNCTDATLPLNAWGVGFIQRELVEKIGNDPSVIALGLAEAWAGVCGSPENVRKALGWNARSAEKNGLAVVARHGFGGPVTWLQLDTSLSTNTEPRYIAHAPVCVDAVCSATFDVFVTHWYASGTTGVDAMVRQAQQSVAFMARQAGERPRAMLGDLNVWEGSAIACGQKPGSPRVLDTLRAAGYADEWLAVNGSAEGFTGMTNRKGCGIPEGHTWKRIDYSWSLGTAAVSMRRFGLPTTPGDAAASDHFGIVAEYPLQGQAEPIVDITAPRVSIRAPIEGGSVTGSVTVAADAQDDKGVARVEFLVDGSPLATDKTAPFSAAWNTSALTNGIHMLQARAFDAAGNIGASTLRTVTVANAVFASVDEIVLHASSASVVGGAWQLLDDATAASGQTLRNPNGGAAKLSAASASPASYAELTFTADEGKPYRLWVRGKAENNHWSNDSTFLQFSDSVDANGTPIWRIGSTSATTVTLENCVGCGVSGWGWQDNGYGTGVLGTPVRFATSGTHTIRIQTREDGLSIDQIVLSAQQFLTDAPGALKNDTTILEITTAVPVEDSRPPADIVLHASAASVTGAWQTAPDATAAGGTLLRIPDAGAPKVSAPAVTPGSYAELTFSAEAGVAYRLWLRGRAERNSWANDSAYVQFSDSVTESGTPVWRIESSSATTITLEDCIGCGVAGWGWQDNGFGAGVLGPLVRFASDGTHTIRIQTREDGFSIDQIVLSSDRWLTAAPGTPKNDSTVLVP